MAVVNVILIALFGLVVGSFLNALTYRLPLGKSIVSGRSICPKCKKKIEWYDNFPLFSYVLLWGRCRKCDKKISARYPLIEASTAFVFVLIYTVYSSCILEFTASPFCSWQQSLGMATLPYFLIVATFLIAIFVIDLEHQVILDELVFAGFVLTVLVMILAGNTGLYGHVFTGFAAALFFLLLHLITKGRGMGLGDSKLALFTGSVLGLQMSLVWLFASFVTGAFVGVLLIALGKAKFGRHIPFGPFLVFSFFITLFWGNWLIKILLPYLIL